MNPTSTEHGLDAYEAKPKKRRRGIGLCLSGGGFRAALFHVGALRRLNELGILSKVTTISAVSGGSIVAAHLASAARWPLPDRIDDFETVVAVPMRRLTAKNLRTWPLLTGILTPATTVDRMARVYERELTPMRLLDLPDAPEFVFCATDMAYGVNWTFKKRRMGDYQLGYVRTPEEWPLARAVAASSCFPPMFNPMPIRFGPEEYKFGMATDDRKRDECIRNLRLTDGGNYDNMGLEPVWKRHEVVLVSDGGATLDFEGDSNLFNRVLRYSAITDSQARALRKRWLISSFIREELAGAYWGIASAAESYGRPKESGYSKELARDLIAEIRTDLDAFSEAEAKVLENHGYLLTDAAIGRHIPRFAKGPTATPPHPEWLDETRVRAALKSSHRRKMAGRW
ncbi:MAG: patatin-like phospholipase family protein [Thermoanaerobaculia bacterium]